ncbi:hypothetical protein [Phyllobacterium sp. YR531]|uniref:hypothetical protein n=1 Tax=Phyllobacterium sp. YR531 TaxID=1144343 RepID=UPI00026FBAD6|nr:hypothetical protein [Phyllobacterium sp. YR531]EJN04250.1 hypothetical protein PMI41_01889 [Phyllobacterium sp. YR531]
MFKSVNDSAAAADGGSLALFVEREDGAAETFMILRSIASRGTPDFNKVTSSLRSLLPDECLNVAEALDRLVPATDPIHSLTEFVQALKEQGTSKK